MAVTSSGCDEGEATAWQGSATFPTSSQSDPNTPPPQDSQHSALADELTERLESLGYLPGRVSHPGMEGVRIHDPARVQPGVNLYCSGHSASAYLVDERGEELHRWSFPVHRAFPDFVKGPTRVSGAFWRHVRLLPEGRLLAIYEGVGLIALDRDSRLLWARPCRSHHDLELLDDGSFWVLTRTVGVDPKIHPEYPFVEDFACRMDSEGNELQRWSVLRALLDSPLVPRDYREMPHSGDVLHTNALEILDGRMEGLNPAFRAGNLLLSLRRVNALIVLDSEDGRLLWYSVGSFDGQHDPRVVDDRHILLFDNRPSAGQSRIVEFDVESEEITWEYRGDPPFFSETCGFVERLDNGNTLVTESNRGHAFEVTREGDIVWEFFSPHHVGNEGELVANLFTLARVPRDQVAWLDARGNDVEER